MSKNRKLLRGIALGILLLCTVYLVYAILSNLFGAQDIMLALAVAAGFIALGSNRNGDKK